ncbi:16S rRNA (guanine(966)-N(2))-methyltransferase RsmD [Candidatus Saccharibacteria bacterium]|nr:16S rRNA (guanine(966)-N(2))-methyltransferase RsmD [Candidatus Saccharibacteria bacterium]
MRIIAGKLGGRTFEAPRGRTTRPMSEKVRGALFNTLGDIEGLTVFDAFSGSGALAYEAISRGAASALIIEQDKTAYKAIDENINHLGLDSQIKNLRANVGGWSNNNTTKQFDLVLLDPPYNNLDRQLLQKLVRHAKIGGLVVLSWPGKEPAPPFEGLEQVTNKNHGDIQLVFYRKIE